MRQAPSEGTAKVGGFDVFDDPLSVRSMIGYLPQRASLYPEMGVVEYLEFAADLRAIPKDKRRGKIKEVVEICGGDRPGNLSTGTAIAGGLGNLGVPAAAAPATGLTAA